MDQVGTGEGPTRNRRVTIKEPQNDPFLLVVQHLLLIHRSGSCCCASRQRESHRSQLCAHDAGRGWKVFARNTVERRNMRTTRLDLPRAVRQESQIFSQVRIAVRFSGGITRTTHPGAPWGQNSWGAARGRIFGISAAQSLSNVAYLRV